MTTPWYATDTFTRDPDEVNRVFADLARANDAMLAEQGRMHHGPTYCHHSTVYPVLYAGIRHQYRQVHCALMAAIADNTAIVEQHAIQQAEIESLQRECQALTQELAARPRLRDLYFALHIN